MLYSTRATAVFGVNLIFDTQQFDDDFHRLDALIALPKHIEAKQRYSARLRGYQVVVSQVIEFSPLCLRRVFSARGLGVLLSELLWVWLPAVMVGGGLWLARRQARSTRQA